MRFWIDKNGVAIECAQGGHNLAALSVLPGDMVAALQRTHTGEDFYEEIYREMFKRGCLHVSIVGNTVFIDQPLAANVECLPLAQTNWITNQRFAGKTINFNGGMIVLLSIQEESKLQYTRLMWTNPAARALLRDYWMQPSHPDQPQFLRRRELIERLLSAKDVSVLYAEFRTAGTSLSEVAKDIPSIYADLSDALTQLVHMSKRIYLAPDGSALLRSGTDGGHQAIADRVLREAGLPVGDAEASYAAMWRLGHVRVLETPDRICAERYLDGRPVPLAELTTAQRAWLEARQDEGKQLVYNDAVCAASRKQTDEAAGK